MTATPEFFVPGVPEDNHEEAFAELARFAGCSVPPPDQRVYRIEWVHDGERWTGEVGKALRGEKIPNPRRKHRAWTEKVSDPAVVHAIFPGVPFIVVTDKVPVGTARSKWENPFMAGRPSRIEHFTPPSA